MKHVLKTKELTKSYNQIPVVNNVNISVLKGDIYGLIGKNGAGKTTLMKMVCGLSQPTCGTFELFESSCVKEQQKRIGCMIEQPALYPNMTARDNLIYYNKLMGIRNNSNIDEILEVVGLTKAQKKKTKKFSLGMKQRLSIAIALLGYPDFLILDEPINGLDPTGIKEIRELILRLNKERNITILISSHILGELSKVATRYGVIESGNLVEEFTKEELEEHCKTCIKIVVDDVKKAAYVLENIVRSKDYKVVDERTIYVYDHLEEKRNINEQLVINGVAVEEMNLAGQDLEAYFMELMGGMAHV